jgi:ATP-binding cassette subfamily F protein uup
VGPNGAGKSTLLDLVAQRIVPESGSIEFGKTVKIGYYDQLGRDLNVNQRVREAVIGDKGDPSVEDLNLMRSFWFDGDAQFAPIHTLSGGERRRLQLLLTLVEQPNVLLLDEPTNDLDLDTLRALEDYLDTWPGIVVVVSHDRAFIDRTVEEIFSLDGDGGAALLVGGVDAWLKMRSARAMTPRTTTLAKAAPPRQKIRTKRSPSTLQRLIDKNEKDLAKRTQRQTDILAAMQTSGDDHEALAALGSELASVQSDIERLENEWLEYTTELED